MADRKMKKKQGPVRFVQQKKLLVLKNIMIAPWSLAELRDRLGLEHNEISSVLEDLENVGLVKRIYVPVDNFKDWYQERLKKFGYNDRAVVQRLLIEKIEHPDLEVPFFVVTPKGKRFFQRKKGLV